MTDTLTTSDLRALKLTEDEWHTLFHSGEFTADSNRVDMLVLAGLAVWKDEPDHPERNWDLTEEGRAACNTIDLIFDWADFAHVEVA